MEVGFFSKFSGSNTIQINMVNPHVVLNFLEQGTAVLADFNMVIRVFVTSENRFLLINFMKQIY